MMALNVFTHKRFALRNLWSQRFEAARKIIKSKVKKGVLIGLGTGAVVLTPQIADAFTNSELRDKLRVDFGLNSATIDYGVIDIDPIAPGPQIVIGDVGGPNEDGMTWNHWFLDEQANFNATEESLAAANSCFYTTYDSSANIDTEAQRIYNMIFQLNTPTPTSTNTPTPTLACF